MKGLAVSFIVWLVTVIPVFSQTYMQMELWVDRVPVSDTTLAPQCLYQKALIYVDPQRFGVVTETDTVALVVTKKLSGMKLYCRDLVTGDNFTFDSYVAKDGFIFFITPDRPLKSKYGLIYSTQPCLK